MPVGVIRVYKTGAIDIKLEEGLKSTIDFPKIFTVALDLDHMESFLDGHLRFASLFLDRENRGASIWHRDIALETCDLDTRELKVLEVLLLEHLDEG
jgi:hypothetical protein